MSNLRFSGTVDHLAIKTDDLTRDIEEYKMLGFAVESLESDWAMMRDSRGFGIALLPPESKHPAHIALKVDTLGELTRAADSEGRPIKEHRDKSLSFYTKGVGASVIEVIYYPDEFYAQK